jgi:hypothetical protein
MIMTTKTFVLRDVRWVDFELQAIITKKRNYIIKEREEADTQYTTIFRPASILRNTAKIPAADCC